jgi:threonine/homoserine/homoserine lactone efflux protein
MIPDSSTVILFVIAAIALLITPGPAVLYIVTRSIDQGRKAGLVSVMGVQLGTLFHVSAAALGLSALLVSSALAFSIVKYAGAVYLIYLGVRKIVVKEEIAERKLETPHKLSAIFYQGIVVNVLNPKTALFFLAFLPQFVDPSRGAVSLQIFFLGMLFVCLGILSDGTYAMLSGSFGKWLKGNLKFLRFQRYFAGGIYIFLGATAALSGSSKNK